jgi:metal-responsive CopG/Arc/MetJ family transcriptional regulator
MARREKVAITLEADLLQRAEKLRRTTGESRSALLNRALQELLRAEDHRRRVEEYVRAYREHPESADEIQSARAAAARTLRHVAWDDEP